MNLTRLLQYTQRIAHVHLSSLPGRYRQKRHVILEEFLQRTVAFLNQLGVEYWLNFGTLLGYHRENGILPQDIDIDIGMHEKYYPLIKQSGDAVNGGLRLFDTSYRHHGPKMYLNYKGFDADLYFYGESGNSLVSYEKTRFSSLQKPIPQNLIFPLSTTRFLGSTVMVPAKVKAYLEFIYGSLAKNAVQDMNTGYWIDPSYEKTTGP